MQKPKILNRYCRKCKKHTEHKVVIISSGHGRGTLKLGGKTRVKRRGGWRGKGNLGKYSKPAIASWKRKTKTTKKTNFMYTCQTCKKSSLQKKGIRTGRVTLTKE